MGVANKAKNQVKRRQKAAVKAKQRIKDRKQEKKTLIPATKRVNIPKVTEAMFPEREEMFWRCHGMNMLVSNFAEGTWTPLFESIYEDRLPKPEELVSALLTKYGPNDTWPSEAKAALAWSVQNREVIYIYKMECVKQLMLKDLDPKIANQPHNGTVWGIFAGLLKSLIEQGSV